MIRDRTNETVTKPMWPFNSFRARLMYGPAFIFGISLKRMFPPVIGGNPSFGSSGSPSEGIALPGNGGKPSLGSASNGIGHPVAWAQVHRSECRPAGQVNYLEVVYCQA